ncbi:MAG: ThuA domain-containing protein [Candidatus Solibacter sp.]|nr:ThuA domain-containing protein [Candidatus Solibacter sp.]
MKPISLVCLIASVLAGAAAAQPAAKRILVYTRQTVSAASSYIHDNAPSSVEAIRKLGAANGFAVDASEDPAVFTEANLKRYQALVFSNTHNEAFQTEAQRQAFQKYIQGGGGFVGLHAATTTERDWPFFTSTIGGRFVRHPKLQKFVVRVQDAGHPATRGLPATFEWEDECYMHEWLNPNMHPLLVADPTKLEDPDRAKFPNDLLGHALPLAWTITNNGQRVFYSALGHKKEHYSDPLLVKHILGAIQWAMGEGK